MRPADGVAHGAMAAGVAKVVIGAHHHASSVAGLAHAMRIGEGQGQRLLAEHVLAGPGGNQGLVAMQLVGGRDVDGVDVLAEQRLESVG